MGEDGVEMEVKNDEQSKTVDSIDCLVPASEETSQPTGVGGQPPYSEKAQRVAQMMRNYLHMKHTVSSGGREEQLSDRCQAMMELVLKENGKWTVSKLETEHNHTLNCFSAFGVGQVEPSIGMVFDSLEAAKTFYYDYGKKMGFRSRTGSNRRSASTGALIMQRFLCCRGSYPLQRRSSETSVGKRKRGPYKGRGGKVFDELAQNEDVDGDVIDVDGLAEKGAMAGCEAGAEVDSRPFMNGIASFGDTKTDAVEVKNGGLPPTTSVSAQSKLLRELGVRVYRYSSDEKRDIILRYLMKKSNRQSGERTIKFFTTQPPPGENFRQLQCAQQTQNVQQQQEVAGNSADRVPLQTCENQDRMTVIKPKPPIRQIIGVVAEPKIGMFFTNEDRAYEFYVRYAGSVGFNVRKGWWDKTARSVTRLRVYVCSKEGFRPKSFVNETKKARPETRTGCPARMAIKLTSNGKYSITEFVSEHNHELAAPLDIQMFKSQKLLTKVQLSNQYRCKLIPADYKNYIRSKRMKNMQVGDAGAMLEYLQKMKGENSSFFYAIQVDEDDQLTNIFWADPNSIMNYDYFGDVLCFDTTYKDSDYGRPFIQFVGVNHHMQAITFGAAFLYDETIESLKWLFETFTTVMGGKQPKTVLTAESCAVSKAIAAVWPCTNHRICVWHIYRSASKNLSQIFENMEAFLLDFSHCIFQLHEEENFLIAWKSMLERYDLKDNEWLSRLYEERKKWALPYSQEAFYADIHNVLRRAGFNCVLKENLSPEVDLIQFLKQYEEFVKEQRYMEQEADYLASQITSRVPTLRFLWQAANVYTPFVYEMFKMEFELLPNCLVYSCGEVGTLSDYEVAVKDSSKLYFVRFDVSDGSVICSCKKFEFVGIQCCHALRVLDCRNVKELRLQFLLKRWRKDAKSGLIRVDHSFPLQNDPKSLSKRYSSLCRLLYQLAARASQSVHAYALLENQSNQMLDQVERIIEMKLLEKPPMSNPSKGLSQSQIQGEDILHDSNGESRRLFGKKKKDGSGCRRQHIEVNKRGNKGRKAKSDVAEVSVDDPPVASNEILTQERNSSNHFFPPCQPVQGSFIPTHQFGLSNFHGFQGAPQFTQMQEPSAPVLQHQPFPGEAHLAQASEMHALQFVASNSQLGHQGGEQGHYTIPVWDFL
ncbi:hypothetical protein HPP92_000811 [Vanilla planifolia]|uniref:SWIM-type domain-containing protein n=1 Tax=Vanilla planifolia TaxID=51239 RepID=A0A835VHE7_VANPL|nr:hypothetical protein HPP92_000811 [Vanilla planifolia]